MWPCDGKTCSSNYWVSKVTCLAANCHKPLKSEGRNRACLENEEDLENVDFRFFSFTLLYHSIKHTGEAL